MGLIKQCLGNRKTSRTSLRDNTSERGINISSPINADATRTVFVSSSVPVSPTAVENTTLNLPIPNISNSLPSSPTEQPVHVRDARESVLSDDSMIGVRDRNSSNEFHTILTPPPAAATSLAVPIPNRGGHNRQISTDTTATTETTTSEASFGCVGDRALQSHANTPTASTPHQRQPLSSFESVINRPNTAQQRHSDSSLSPSETEEKVDKGKGKLEVQNTAQEGDIAEGSNSQQFETTRYSIMSGLSMNSEEKDATYRQATSDTVRVFRNIRQEHNNGASSSSAPVQTQVNTHVSVWSLSTDATEKRGSGTTINERWSEAFSRNSIQTEASQETITSEIPPHLVPEAETIPSNTISNRPISQSSQQTARQELHISTETMAESSSAEATPNTASTTASLQLQPSTHETTANNSPTHLVAPSPSTSSLRGAGHIRNQSENDALGGSDTLNAYVSELSKNANRLSHA